MSRRPGEESKALTTQFDRVVDSAYCDRRDRIHDAFGLRKLELEKLQHRMWFIQSWLLEMAELNVELWMVETREPTTE